MAIQNAGSLITSPQTVTGSWVDVGSAVESVNYSFFSTYIDLDVNNSKNVQFRFRGLYEETGSDYIIPIKSIKTSKILLDDFYYELDSDVDQNVVLQTQIDQNVNLTKLQVRAETVGSPAAIVTEAKYIQGYRQ